MAGDTKETGAPVLDPSDALISDPFPGIQATLDGILDELRGVTKEGPSIFDLTALGAGTFGQHQWQRLRIAEIIATASAAGTLILTIGSFPRTLNLAVGINRIPFPVTIERATDVSIGGTAVGLTAYAIATPE